MAEVERFHKLSEEEREARKMVLGFIKDLEEDMKQLNVDPTPLVYDGFQVFRDSESGIIVVESTLGDDHYWVLTFATFRSCAEFCHMNLINGGGKFSDED